jgi:putative heme-binding domain-containing protein
MRLLQSYPKAGAIVRREIARCLAGIGARTPEARILISANLTDQSDVRDDIHHLMVLSRLKSPATPSTRQAITNALFRLEGKYTQQKLGRDRHWNLRLRETVTALIEHDPHLATAILAHPKFGTAEQIWLLSVPGWEARTVARKILAHADKDPMFGWTPALVSRLSSLPVTDVRPAVTKLRQIPELRESVTILLAAEPHEEDRDLFARGLNSGSSSVVSASAKGLTQLTSISRLTDEELLTTFRSLQRFSDVKLDADVRRHLYTLLKSKTGKTFPEKDAIWIKWLEETQAELARKLRTTPGYDAQAWQARLKLVPRDKGNAERGKQLFVRAQCQACHNGGSAVGPSLEGVSKRFSRDDLLVAILDPSREIPARYRTTRIATREGKVFEGIIVYDAPDGILLQVSSEETVRIAGDSIEERTPGNRSLMPAGLLDDFKPEEIADLLAYLK